MSATDTDLIMREALGLRWSILGALETCHLNAPNGIAQCPSPTPRRNHLRRLQTYIIFIVLLFSQAHLLN